LEIRVFFTWHTADTATHDPGFRREIAWDIPLTEGYDFELVPNISRHPGSNRFFGMRTPELVSRVQNWKPDVIHITGYAYASHLYAIRTFHRSDIPVLFRGDSHLLDQTLGPRWWLKKTLLSYIYGWTTACLYVGHNNYHYYAKIGVPEDKLHYCPHCIEVDRFAEPSEEFEAKALMWRRELVIASSAKVVLYAGKFEERKQPIQLMHAIKSVGRDDLILVLVGNGPLEKEIEQVAKLSPKQFRIIPFQNQTKMPVVYRLGDVVVLPSSRGETWGLGLNEALACGRRTLASDKVGGAIDVIRSSSVGAIFRSGDWSDFASKLDRLLAETCSRYDSISAARKFDVAVTEETLLRAVRKTLSSSE
jgi:glycosyltransferase involved in cell wall biosynthesis